MTLEREPVPADLQELYGSAQTPEPPPGLEDQLFAKLQAVTAAAVAPAAAAGAPAVGGAVLGKFGALLAAGTFVAGLGGGALVTTQLAPPPPPPIVQTVYVDRPVPVPVAPEAVPSPPPPVVVEKPKPAAAPSTGQLVEEQRLVETARSALFRRDGALARVPLEAHRRRFPNGEHAEERDALLIQSFIIEGDLKTAREKLAELEAKHPQSFFVGPLKTVLEQAESP